MLLITSQSLRGTKSISDAARELSLSLTVFASSGTLAQLMGGSSRRLVLLTEADASDGVVDALRDAEPVFPLNPSAVTNRILDDLVAVLHPRRIKLLAEFSPRGGIRTNITARYTQK